MKKFGIITAGTIILDLQPDVHEETIGTLKIMYVSIITAVSSDPISIQTWSEATSVISQQLQVVGCVIVPCYLVHPLYKTFRFGIKRIICSS